MNANDERFVTFLTREDMSQPEVQALGIGRAAVFTARCAGKPTPNEDAAALIPINACRGVIVVADGFGGQPAGDEASHLAVRCVIEAVGEVPEADGALQAAILGGFDHANAAVRGLGVGAATTLAVVELDGEAIRPYHVGDSEILIVGQRGRIKLQTISHSPVGYRVEAGVLDETEALHHEDRHVVSNMVGSEAMHIDVGPAVRLRPRDTVLIASDGLFDNLAPAEIVELIRKGDLLQSTGRLIDRCRERMNGARPDPCKPDDLTVVAFRLR